MSPFPERAYGWDGGSIEITTVGARAWPAFDMGKGPIKPPAVRHPQKWFAPGEILDTTAPQDRKFLTYLQVPWERAYGLVAVQDVGRSHGSPAWNIPLSAISQRLGSAVRSLSSLFHLPWNGARCQFDKLKVSPSSSL